MNNLSARNPLGIIALFISLIYGISALLLGTSVSKLAVENQERLVWFIIAFPVAILFAFLYLVTWHHKKLYGPGDFRSDEGFLSIGDPAAIGLKYIKESVDDTALESGDTSQVESKAEESELENARPYRGETTGVTAGTTVKAGEATSSSEFSLRSPSVSYMLEGLVMQELQSEFSSSIRRDARLAMLNGRVVEVDGIIETLGGPIFVEIKRIGPRSDWLRRLRDGVLALRSIMLNAPQASASNGRGMLVLITDNPISHEMRARANKDAGSNEFPIDVRFYQSHELLSKYGLDPAQLDD